MSERCHFCGAIMVWDGDDTGDEGELKATLHCSNPNCNATAEWTQGGPKE